MNRFIEIPANKFGRRVAALIKWPAFPAVTAPPTDKVIE
jgi:hypothetical protein